MATEDAFGMSLLRQGDVCMLAFQEHVSPLIFGVAGPWAWMLDVIDF
jgi:hypothetical protein